LKSENKDFGADIHIIKIFLSLSNKIFIEPLFLSDLLKNRLRYAQKNLKKQIL